VSFIKTGTIHASLYDLKIITGIKNAAKQKNTVIEQ
jgi:hypothetical protein